jgi:hypothetical protein
VEAGWEVLVHRKKGFLFVFCFLAEVLLLLLLLLNSTFGSGFLSDLFVRLTQPHYIYCIQQSYLVGGGFQYE